MRRPRLGHRLGIYLCGAAIAAGCSSYQGRQNVAAAADVRIPPRTAWTAGTTTTPSGRVEFDLQAVKYELTQQSPYCQINAGVSPSGAAATFHSPPSATPGFLPRTLPENQVSPPDGPPTVPTGATVGTPRVADPTKELPGTPPLHAASGLGFAESPCAVCAPCGGNVAPAGAREVVQAGCTSCAPCATCTPCEVCTFCAPCKGAAPCATCSTCATPGPCTACAPCASCTPSGTVAAPPPPPIEELKALYARSDSAGRRRSFVDITAAPCFGHAPDYCWLSGQVEYSRILRSWRLRYASVDETDRFGGSVTLVENAHVSYLRDGEYVKVEGHLVNPNAEGSSPAYRIESFKVIDHPNTPSPTAEAQ